MQILLWPIRFVWRVLTAILALTGRLIALLIGFVLLLVGALLTITGIGAIVGIPFMALGFLLIVRGLF